MTEEAILAAGAVVWRRVADGGRQPDAVEAVEVLLVHRAKYDDWSLPKGKCEPGEHVLLTAVREVLEETSVRPVLGPRLPTVEYLSPRGPKRVNYWSAVGGGHAAPAHEVDAVSWLPVAKAVQQVSYPQDADLISSLRPRETTPLILARHASAGSKDDWDGDDELRPLDAKGAVDAAVLARLMACFAPRARVVSSPALRCTQTMQPFAAAFGGPVEAVPALAPPSSQQGNDAAVRRLVADLVAAGRPTVVCVHRENLLAALTAACSALGAPSAVPQDPSLPKGGFWAVHAAAGELAALERYELLALASSRRRRRSTRRVA
jgi:phosphohistidine phosphatase SixA/predicted NUDIX family NTP pyrophosphohydrolase